MGTDHFASLQLTALSMSGGDNWPPHLSKWPDPNIPMAYIILLYIDIMDDLWHTRYDGYLFCSTLWSHKVVQSLN